MRSGLVSAIVCVSGVRCIILYLSLPRNVAPRCSCWACSVFEERGQECVAHRGESWPERCVPRMYNLPQYVISLCLLGSRAIYSPLRFILINALYIITLHPRQSVWQRKRKNWDKSVWDRNLGWAVRATVGGQAVLEQGKKKHLCMSCSTDANIDEQNEDHGMKV